ncbi:flippase [Bacillus sp. FJAT-50079]|uniref:flippase n=1 Tax=Bacillus sp. FJAT-50079 TaxID=2833577 RepID=UPI001BC9FC0C|nr:flippase [Bacillus sp. FJAT-50079]MBS4206751.1 flippase [Bacillus sp. FJAT-50079]
MSDSKFTKDTILTLSRQVTGILLGLLLTVIIARELGTEGNGMYALIVLLPTMLMAFLNMGVGSATVYYIGRNKYRVETIIKTNTITALILSLVSIVCGLIFLLLFYQNSSFNEIPIAYLYGILFTVPVLIINEFYIVVFQGKNDFKAFNSLALSRQIVSLVSLVIFIYLFQIGLIGAVFSFIIGSITQLMITVYYFRSRMQINFSVGKFSKEYFIDSLKFGIKAHFSNMLSFINYRADTIVISYFSTNAAVGLYNIAVNVAERLWIVSQSISSVLFPRVAALNEEDEKNQLTSLVTRTVLWFSIISGVVFYLIAELFIGLLFGQDYQESAVVLKVLLPGIILFSMDRIMSNDLAGRGKPELNMYTSIFTVVGNLVLNIILVPRYGIYGAAFSTSLTYSLSTIIKMFIFKSLTGISLYKLILVQREDYQIYKKLLNAFRRGR